MDFSYHVAFHRFQPKRYAIFLYPVVLEGVVVIWLDCIGIFKFVCLKSRSLFIYTLEKTEGAIKNGQSRDTFNFEYTRHRMKTGEPKSTTRKTKTMRNTNPTKNRGEPRCHLIFSYHIKHMFWICLQGSLLIEIQDTANHGKVYNQVVTKLTPESSWETQMGYKVFIWFYVTHLIVHH